MAPSSSVLQPCRSRRIKLKSQTSLYKKSSDRRTRRLRRDEKTLCWCQMRSGGPTDSLRNHRKPVEKRHLKYIINFSHWFVSAEGNLKPRCGTFQAPEGHKSSKKRQHSDTKWQTIPLCLCVIKIKPLEEVLVCLKPRFWLRLVKAGDVPLPAKSYERVRSEERRPWGIFSPIKNTSVETNALIIGQNVTQRGFTSSDLLLVFFWQEFLGKADGIFH